MSEDSRVQWFKDTLQTNDAQANTDQSTIWDFTGSGFTDMHTNVNTEGNDVIDAIINNPNSPVYVGDQFRGLKIWGSNMESGVTPEQFIKNIIKGGIWREEGATSFSASEDVANSFAAWNNDQSGYVSVKVKYVNPTTGMPIKHLSKFSYEDEVLHSRSQMTNGYNIINSKWSNDRKKVVITIADR